MKAYIPLTVCCLLGASVCGATKDDPSITVEGEAKQMVEPDRAYLVLYSVERDNSPETVMEESLENVEKAMETLKKKYSSKLKAEIVNTGLAYVKTDGGEAEKNYEFQGAHCFWVGCKPDDETVFSMIYDATKVYTTISPPGSVEGSLPFSPVIYAVEKYEAIEAGLEKKALENAKARAALVAEENGMKLGEILSIQRDLISAAGRNRNFPTPHISGSPDGVLMVASATVTYQLLPN